MQIHVTSLVMHLLTGHVGYELLEAQFRNIFGGHMAWNSPDEI